MAAGIDTIPRMKIYLGYLGREGYEIFRSWSEPTAAVFGGKYSHVVGPFRTYRAAEFMQRYGRGNPHMQTVAQAEKIAANFARLEKKEKVG